LPYHYSIIKLLFHYNQQMSRSKIYTMDNEDYNSQIKMNGKTLKTIFHDSFTYFIHPNVHFRNPRQKIT
ncbi:hypothetical protein, partial [Vibrio echinoideorum]